LLPDEYDMSKVTQQPKVKGLIGYDPALEPEIFDFQQAAYPTRRTDWIAPRWRWMFLASAQRLGVPPMVWLYRNASGIVAHQGAIPVKLKVGEQEHTTGWFVETMALESVRGKTIGPMLIKKALEDLPFNLSLGQTPQMRTIQLTMGWTQVAPLGTYVLLLNPREVLAAKIAPWIARDSAALGLAALQLGKRTVGRRRLRWQATISEITHFDSTHDALWDTVKDAYQCAVVRDAAYLNWKYVDQPGQSFVRLEIRREGTVVAIAIVLIVEPGAVYPYRRGFLVDMVVPAADREVVWATLDAVRRVCQDQGVALLTCYLISQQLQKAVTSFGFFPKEPTRFLLVATDAVSAQVNSIVLSPERWFVTLGDSDIDRPW
jgi:hypothetical protein